LTQRTLDDWLAYISAQHPATIALGLDRVHDVWKRMDLGDRFHVASSKDLGDRFHPSSSKNPSPLVVTVGGTNGKGSTCAFLERILIEAGYRVGLYTSPHLLRYNERVRLQGEEVDDAALAASFARVEAARGATPLTYFEFGTLAALAVFAEARIEAAILEVGLGGRLDAVNIIDADCAIVVSVDLDHQSYLGNDRESIGREKAGIFRAGRPAVIAEPDPPRSVLAAPGEKLLFGKHFGYTDQRTQWSYWGPAGKRGGLGHPALRGAVQLRNAAAAMCALDCLREKLPLGMQDIRRGLAEVTLPARFQVLPGRPQVILDVAHNPQAAGEYDIKVAD
jgi:dihydrofolate synthase/folylpolyglutamate synthase